MGRTNYPGGNPNGSTEYIDFEKRIIIDAWNSKELDFDYAMAQYNLNPNNFKPTVLPDMLFRIFSSDTPYSNYQMLANDTMTVQFFTQPIAYGDFTTTPVTTVTVKFPPTEPININKWVFLVTQVFTDTQVEIPGQPSSSLSNFLSLDWSFYPFKLSYVYNRAEYLKITMFKTANASPYTIRFLGPWNLLQFFGKSIGMSMGDCTPGTAMSMRGPMKSRSITHMASSPQDG